MPSPAAARGARLCAIAVVAMVLLFAAWQLLLPAQFQSVRGLNPRAVVAWRQWWRLATPAIPVGTYRAVFRTLIVAAWLAYAGLLWLVARGARFASAWTWPLATVVAVTLAVAMPPTLSTDVFAYVGYARLAVVHGLNPHLHTQAELVRLLDPTTPYLRWPIPSPYGPLWTLFSMGVVFLGRLISPANSEVAAVVLPVIVFKLVAAVALIASAALARAIVRRTAPERAASVFVLVALNPLLLIEGPGNGHNDLVMMALLLAAVAAVAWGHFRRAALALGVGAAVKLVPLIVVPWFAALAARAAGRSRLLAVASTVVLALLPLVVAYAPLWAGARTLGGVVARWEKGDPTNVADSVPPSAGRPAPDAGVAPAGGAGPGAISAPSRRGRMAGLRWAAILRRLLYASPALLIYVWATLAICLGQGDAAYRLATFWSYLALGILCFAAGLWCSWYLAWLWPALVLRFTRPHRVLMAFAVPFSLLLMLAYATPPG